jgi:hypothetical protein
MVKGPCRGNKCDFWARVKLQKRSVKQLVREIYDSIIECEDGSALNIEVALAQFWCSFGIKDMKRLCLEDPSLCKKIAEVEQIILS